MRGSMAPAAAAAILVVSGFVAPCLAQGGGGTGKPGQQESAQQRRVGTVTAVDTQAATVTCHWASSDWTFSIDPAKTSFRNGSAPAAFSDLKPGQFIEILFHKTSGRPVADLVVFSQ